MPFPSITPWRVSLLLALSLSGGSATAHNPVFGLGPHVLYKGGLDIALDTATGRAGSQRDTRTGFEFTYGLTGNWTLGAELPYRFRSDQSNRSEGAGDLSLFTKYRFWRHDSLGQQSSAAVSLKAIFDTADSDRRPPLGKGATDTLLGLSYGYESRRWYRWASIRYRHNGSGPGGIDRGDRLLVDLVGGIRPNPSGYLEPDTVWLLELNGEHTWADSRAGQRIANTGGQQWFLSPGIFWTLRNFAVKAGVQIPVHSNLDGDQPEADYRARLTLEWHM
ncbi:transporter [Thiohalobacter sp.]|uniref:transporter n=1 Tax=Thiohalobacter sp. TaxID=2025948 RepID=UPI002612CBC4|nr:transporter [Thiohalobacter sp.]